MSFSIDFTEEKINQQNMSISQHEILYLFEVSIWDYAPEDEVKMKRSSDLKNYSYITVITDGNMMVKDKTIMCTEIDVAQRLNKR